jgi:hypothetical protein
VIAKIRTQEDGSFDWSKLLQLAAEVNASYRRGNAYAVHALLRAILDHVPPLRDLLSIEDVPPRAWINRLLQECSN